MIVREQGNLREWTSAAPSAARALERDGYAVLRGALEPRLVEALTRELTQAFDGPGSIRAGEDEGPEFRHEMLNRGRFSQEAVGHPRILEAIEPLLGADCHVIANTAWRNGPSFGGGPWHCDAGPHVPRPEGVPWDERIAYPVFAIGAHLYLQPCPRVCGPTAVVPGSHRSGRLPPSDRGFDETLSYEGRTPVLLEAEVGDVVLFVSDVWHRGTPAQPGATGRFFLQAHYGRRDIAQRLRTTDACHQLSEEALARARSARQRTLVGLHDPHFYDG